MMKFSYDKQKYIARGIPTDEDDNLDIIPGEVLERRKTS